MKALISSIDGLLAKVDNGTLSLQELELLVDDARELYERLVVLRYKVYEEDVLGAKSPVVETVVAVETSAPVEETASTEETSFEFDLFASETPEPTIEPVIAATEAIVEAPTFDLAPEIAIEENIEIEENEPVPSEQAVEMTFENEPAEEELPMIEEHHSVSHSTEEVAGTIVETVTEHHVMEEQTETSHSFTEETTIVTTPIEAAAPEVEEVVEKPSISFGNSHPLAPGLFQIAKNVRSKSNIMPLDSLIGSFTLNEKLLFINELFGGSSDNFSNAVKKLDSQQNLSVAMEAMAEMAATYAWDMESDTIEEFMHKICRRYALASA